MTGGFRWIAVAGLMGLATVLARGAARQQETAVINWTSSSPASNRVVVEVRGLSSEALARIKRTTRSSAEWQELFAVYVEQGDPVRDPWLPPMNGHYRADGGVLAFEPLFPLEPGLQYRAVFRPGRLTAKDSVGLPAITSVFRRAAPGAAADTFVTAVYPSAEVLPENLLKFYVHFSAPMSRGHIYEHIHLYADGDRAVELPFLEIDEELWDAKMTRLTLFIDPGRIKRGVTPLKEIGPALEDGKGFTLVIDKNWRDAAGNKLKQEFRKGFKVGPTDREPPDPKRWTITAPSSGSRNALSVRFPEPMDHALALRMIRIANSADGAIEGESGLSEHERVWSFVPTAAWRAGTYRLTVQTTIEDLAGNNIGKPFEVDLFEGVQRRLTNSLVSQRFEIR